LKKEKEEQKEVITRQANRIEAQVEEVNEAKKVAGA